MPRKYVRKTERGSWDTQKMNEAVAMVQKGVKLRSAADACQVPRTTLRRHLQKLLRSLLFQNILENGGFWVPKKNWSW